MHSSLKPPFVPLSISAGKTRRTYLVIFLGAGLILTWIIFYHSSPESASLGKENTRPIFKVSAALSPARTARVNKPSSDVANAEDIASHTPDIAGIFNELISRKPIDAVGWFEKQDLGENRESILRDISDVWAGKAYLDQLAWAGKLTNPQEREIALEIGLNHRAKLGKPSTKPI